jgi:hypothetical protein
MFVSLFSILIFCRSEKVIAFHILWSTYRLKDALGKPQPLFLGGLLNKDLLAFGLPA